ncbi:MAG: DUF421 domain-containing protein [Oscillospiraceae bacterium]
MEFLRIILLSSGSLAALFVLTKIMGNKQVSQLSLFDYINGITIGSIAAEMATSLDGDFWKPLTAMAVYAFFAIVISLVTNKSIRLRRLFTGTSMLLFDGGKIFEKNLSKAKIDINELLMQARNKGFFDIADLETAILEPNGQVSFLPKSGKRAVCPLDLGISPSQERIPSNLIIDGKILEGNLKHVGKDVFWLKKQIKSQGIRSVSDVFLATCDGQNKLSVYVKIKKINKIDTID